ncbi:ndufs1 NADH-ubiquinone oxidoreductase subunit [Sorochytrium milnesiophthora]
MLRVSLARCAPLAAARRLAAAKKVTQTQANLAIVVGNAGTRAFSGSQRLHNEVELFVNGKSVKVEQGAALIQACEKAGVDVPRFCYHERLAVAGNCRMCLVELEKSPKPVASCAMPVMPGMKVHTDTPLVKRAREGVMECPICDQGGECDLQDQSVRYGSDRSRFDEVVGKRAVEDKDLGPLVKTTMTRCIQCTRCVRFANEIAGAEELGTSGRGNDMQIGTYIEKTLDSEMSGNIIDLCPVGALTSKPYESKARPWELKKTESIDVHDAVGCNIRVDSRGVEVMRVLPRENDDINEQWLSDKSRFAYDGLKRQRLTTPMVKQGDSFVPTTWEDALHRVGEAMRATKGSDMAAVAGHLADTESLVALKDLFAKLGSSDFRLDSAKGALPAASGFDVRSNYLFNSTIAGVDEADAVLLIGCNPRHEAPIINTRIRKGYLHNASEIGLIGAPHKLNYEYAHIGQDASGIDALIRGDHPFAEKLAKAKRPLVIVGSGVNDHDDRSYVFGAVAKLAQKYTNLLQPDWNGVNLLQRAASHTAALDIGFQPTAKSSSPKLLYLLNADEIDGKDIPSDAFVVYQGHHGDSSAMYADIILPGAAYTEKSATYVNTEGRPQETTAAVSPPGAAREDWKIIRAVSEFAGEPLPYDDVSSVRDRMAEIAPHLAHYSSLEPSSLTKLAFSAPSATGSSKPSGRPLNAIITDFYRTDAISRASSTMAKCAAAFGNSAARV